MQFKWEESFTDYGWRKLIVDCDAWSDIGDHKCVLSDKRTYSFIEEVLNEKPELWAKPEKRPTTYSEEINKGFFQKLWEGFLDIFK